MKYPFRRSACRTCLAGTFFLTTPSLAAAAAALVLTCTATSAVAQAPIESITYQGRLDFGGRPFDGIVDVRFTVLDAPDADAPALEPIVMAGLPVRRGIFTATLDVPRDLFGDPRWMEVAVRVDEDPFVVLGEPVLVSPAFSSSLQAGLSVRPISNEVLIGPVLPDLPDPGALTVGPESGDPSLVLTRGAVEFGARVDPDETLVVTRGVGHNNVLTLTNNRELVFDSMIATLDGVEGIIGPPLGLSIAISAGLGIDAAGRIFLGSPFASNSPVNFVHSNVGSGWGTRIENAAQGSFVGGMRLSDDGFLDVTNRANAAGAAFARLNSSGNWTSVSDARRKTGVEPFTDVLERATELSPVTYRYRTDGPDGRQRIGFLAQDVRRLFPSLVEEGADGLTLDYATLNVVAIAGVQEQEAAIRAFADDVDAAASADAAEADDVARMLALAARLEAALDEAAASGATR